MICIAVGYHCSQVSVSFIEHHYANILKKRKRWQRNVIEFVKEQDDDYFDDEHKNYDSQHVNISKMPLTSFVSQHNHDDNDHHHNNSNHEEPHSAISTSSSQLNLTSMTNSEHPHHELELVDHEQQHTNNNNTNNTNSNTNSNGSNSNVESIHVVIPTSLTSTTTTTVSASSTITTSANNNNTTSNIITQRQASSTAVIAAANSNEGRHSPPITPRSLNIKLPSASAIVHNILNLCTIAIWFGSIATFIVLIVVLPGLAREICYSLLFANFGCFIRYCLGLFNKTELVKSWGIPAFTFVSNFLACTIASLIGVFVTRYDLLNTVYVDMC